MNVRFVCPECFSDHNDPADAGLGYRVACLDCAILSEPEVMSVPIATTVSININRAVAA